MASLLEMSGGGPQKQPKYAPIFIDRAFTGYFTQRAPLHDPSNVYESKFYGGRPDALWMGLNIELTNRLTLQRRPGTIPLAGAAYSYPTTPVRSYAFQLTDGTIRLVVDTASTPLFALTSVVDASGGTTVYTGTITGGGSNAYAGLRFTVDGFTNGANNGAFICTASSITTLTLKNALGVSETVAATALSSGAVYWDKQNGTAVVLYAKSAGAGQSYFLGSAGILYVGDGVDTWKWTPQNLNINPQSPSGQSVWNWGIVAPADVPTYIITASGAASTTWQKNTIYSTAGLTVDAYNQVWQLIGVNADASQTATAQYGTAGDGAPPFNPALFSITTETSGSGITWKNMGQILPRVQNGFYGDLGHNGGSFVQPCVINEAGSLYGNYNNSGGSSQATGHPVFGGQSQGSGVWDGPEHGGCHWFDLGTYAQMNPWKPGHSYTGWYSGGDVFPQLAAANAVVWPYILPPPTLISAGSNAATPVYLFVPTISGTSGSSYAPFPDYTNGGASKDGGIGQTQPDGQLEWLCLGWATWQASQAYVPWTLPNTTFGCIYDGTNMQICIVASGTGLSGTTAPGVGSNPAWGTNYGDHTPDGDLTWVCVGPYVTWVGGSSTTGIWHLPLSGFAPPQATQKFGGSTLNASNGTVQTVISSGKSGTTAPTWTLPTDTPNTVTDNGITWLAESLTSTNSLAFSKGYAYAYSYKARAFDDYYSPAPLGGGNVPPGVSRALGSPLGSATNAVSSASPATVFPIGSNAGAVITVSGSYSTDPQVDTIIIWRSADGGGEGEMFELTEIPNVVGSGTWSFNDYLPDIATAASSVGGVQYPGLNTLIPAPVDSVNNPPFSTFLPQVYNFQRIWGADGEFVDFSGGPDTLVGNPDECFNPSDGLPFLAPVTRLVKTAQGLITFLTDSVQVIAGGPLTSSFFSVEWASGIGLLSYNALDTFAGEIYFFSSDNQFRVMTPSLNIQNAGFPLGDQFANQPTSGTSDATWNAANVYVASHQSGVDNAIFVADGSTGWYRLNPRQSGGMPNPEPVWSPYAAITGGCEMVQSVETQPGIKKLLVGGTAATGPVIISERKLTVFTDNGTQYDAQFTMGSISLCHPGQLALLKFMEFDFSGVNFNPTVSYLLNEISGTFTPFVQNPVFDPPSLYGLTITPASYSPNRYYFLGNASLARCRHLQLRVDFGTTSNGDEIFNATIFGRLMVEN